LVDEDGRVVDLLLYSSFSLLPSRRPVLIRAKAPVRLSFAGGGTDFTRHFENGGGAVVSATIDRYCQATISLRNDARITIHSLDSDVTVEMDSVDDIEYDGNLDLLKAAIRVVRPQFGFDLYTDSDVPLGSGLGGSSSMAVAVVGVLYHLMEGHLEEHLVADLAYQAERVDIGIMGGWQDQYAAAFGGFNFLEFTPGEVIVHPLRISDRVRSELESNLLMCFTGRTRDSGDLHAADAPDPQTRNNLDLHSQMIDLAQATKESLLTGHLVRFGQLLNDAWQAKKQYGERITNSRIDHLYAVARENGALGGKLLGAGDGGYLLFYCDPLTRHRTVKALEGEGVDMMGFKFDDRGVRVWRSEHGDGEVGIGH
jgi:D-glycero-alpha-D-manno-heptose-7-phosphate kinase